MVVPYKPQDIKSKYLIEDKINVSTAKMYKLMGCMINKENPEETRFVRYIYKNSNSFYKCFFKYGDETCSKTTPVCEIIPLSVGITGHKLKYIENIPAHLAYEGSYVNRGCNESELYELNVYFDGCFKYDENQYIKYNVNMQRILNYQLFRDDKCTNSSSNETKTVKECSVCAFNTTSAAYTHFKCPEAKSPINHIYLMDDLSTSPKIDVFKLDKCIKFSSKPYYDTFVYQYCSFTAYNEKEYIHFIYSDPECKNIVSRTIVQLAGNSSYPKRVYTSKYPESIGYKMAANDGCSVKDQNYVRIYQPGCIVVTDQDGTRAYKYEVYKKWLKRYYYKSNKCDNHERYDNEHDHCETQCVKDGLHSAFYSCQSLTNPQPSGTIETFMLLILAIIAFIF